MKRYITILIITMCLMFSGCSTTNKHDAEIAKARYEYGTKVNERKPMFEIKGELRCTESQINSGNCGLIVYNTNQRYINIEPQKTDYYGTTLNFLGKVINPFFQWKMNESNNEWGFKRQQSSDSMFTSMFNGLANVKGSGVTNTYTDSFNDNSKMSTIQDSYNSSDSSYTDSFNTKSGDAITDSYNQWVTDTQTSTSTQGDTTNTNTTTTSTTENIPPVE